MACTNQTTNPCDCTSTYEPCITAPLIPVCNDPEYCEDVFTDKCIIHKGATLTNIGAVDGTRLDVILSNINNLINSSASPQVYTDTTGDDFTIPDGTDLVILSVPSIHPSGAQITLPIKTPGKVIRILKTLPPSNPCSSNGWLIDYNTFQSLFSGDQAGVVTFVTDGNIWYKSAQEVTTPCGT